MVSLKEMNPDSRWRFNIARQVAYIYTQNRDTAAVIVGGSTARGHADRFSDIEIGVFWHKPPTDAARARVIERVDADLIRLYPFLESEQVWCDDFMIGRAESDQPKSGLLTEVAHHTVEVMQITLDAVLLAHDPDPIKQNLIAGVLDGIPISGAALLSEWKSRAGAYPRELALAAVQQHAQIDQFWRWKMWLARDDNRMMLYQSFIQVQNKLLHILLGLNRQYYAGFKWLDLVIDRMVVKPKNFADRLKRIYHLNPSEGAQLLADLVEETYDLIETHLPEINIGWLRRVFRYQRPIFNQEPKHIPILFTKGLSDDI